MKYIILAIFIPLFLVGCSNKSDEDNPAVDVRPPAYQQSNSVGVPKIDNSKPGTVKPTQGEVIKIDMIAKQWDFQPSTVTVSQGDTVRLNIRSIDVSHGIALPDFGISEDLAPGQTTSIEFVADKKGTFTFFCNVYCGAGHGEMRGLLIVQ